MTNIKMWLEKNLNDVKIEETIYLKPFRSPYIVVDDSVSHRGSDEENHIVEHDVIIELYAPTKKEIQSVSVQLDTLLHDIEYRTDFDYIKDEHLYIMTYSFNLIEKE